MVVVARGANRDAAQVGGQHQEQEHVFGTGHVEAAQLVTGHVEAAQLRPYSSATTWSKAIEAPDLADKIKQQGKPADLRPADGSQVHDVKSLGEPPGAGQRHRARQMQQNHQAGWNRLQPKARDASRQLRHRSGLSVGRCRTESTNISQLTGEVLRGWCYYCYVQEGGRGKSEAAEEYMCAHHTAHF